MRTNTLATAVALSDQDLLARIDALAGNEREATAELVAHLAALELRPSLYLAKGYGSLFAYCTEALRLSEDAACNRIEAARACRRFPVILDLLSCGSVTLTAVRRLGPHLTPENHEQVLARAHHQRKEQIEALLAELAPQPDVASSVRRLPAPKPMNSSDELLSAPAPLLKMDALVTRTNPQPDSGSAANTDHVASLPVMQPTTSPVSAPRPVLQALAPGRYRIQFTVGQEGYDKLRRLQTLLRRELPTGDPGMIFERFVDVLLDKVERDKLGKRATARGATRVRRSVRASKEARATEPAYENRIRSRTDKAEPRDTPIRLEGGTTQRERRTGPSRYIPNAVKRAVWFRDRGQCAFVADTGHRCTERTFLELHHIQPFALDGLATVRNMALRCARHNQYEAELVFRNPQRHST